ncbi:MAG TPA: zf-TFIIB domain-containing protein [Gammaproteobacteria bacterium]
MKCPVDQTELLMSDRQGIEIDYCPKCRGVWLDRGELDKIIERSAAAAPPRDVPRGRHEDYGPEPYERDRYERDYDDHRRYRKRKSFLDELFDFD